MQETKIWKVNHNILTELNKSNLDYEDRIHKWIENDIKIILPDAILIGSKIKTDHLKEIDLLAIDSSGDLIIIELKRGNTTRDVVAQALDYTAWASTLKAEDLTAILQKQNIHESIYELLNKNFDDGEQIEINENQKILIVASEVDAITERVINYLSTKGLNINAVTFNYYKDDNSELVARNFLIKRNEIFTTDENKRNGRFITKLFNEGKLLVGHKVRYIPLNNKGVDNFAEIVRKGSKCLKITGTDETFSFSGLRKKFILDNQLNDYNAYFPYNQWGEWELIGESENKELAEL
ncbi:PDDEXK family nuclease [Flavobacterium tructae]|uniref:DUF91 domain-containing protein n=1 Tax=Flavobacterium tructae TaxID=1114873 RepID=A0A1S1J800_9FLAO|nr:hypothetical protein [Flavobacterium tructae]OHT45629.1 hypothetical protein BHE19_07280 [Flavobacterium tructae]OXB18287.1 hypothetical protein B0A71_15305 [Flavobacterium tructae]